MVHAYLAFVPSLCIRIISTAFRIWTVLCTFTFTFTFTWGRFFSCCVAQGLARIASSCMLFGRLLGAAPRLAKVFAAKLIIRFADFKYHDDHWSFQYRSHSISAVRSSCIRQLELDDLCKHIPLLVIYFNGKLHMFDSF